MITAALTGYGAAFSLILAIGAQNAFVLRQGLRREHVFLICLICALSDAILITAGIWGFGSIVAAWPAFPKVMAWGGAAFLCVYALSRFRAAYRGDESLELAQGGAPLWPTVLTCLALTWLNPHVYLDTLGLIGAISTGFEDGTPKLAFGTGAVSASFSFFFALGYGARFLAPLMQSPRAWQILDILVGCLMLAIAAMLIL